MVTLNIDRSFVEYIKAKTVSSQITDLRPNNNYTPWGRFTNTLQYS